VASGATRVGTGTAEFKGDPTEGLGEVCPGTTAVGMEVDRLERERSWWPTESMEWHKPVVESSPSSRYPGKERFLEGAHSG
jgi:hypothetical protein